MRLALRHTADRRANHTDDPTIPSDQGLDVARHQGTQKFGPAAVPDLPDPIGSVPSEADLPG
jgi:hypothetical protein